MGNFKTIIKRFYQKTSGQVKHLSKDIKIEKKWFGNGYGGFFVHPNVLSNKSIIYSVGIGEDISFDLAIINDYDCNIFGFDPTPKSIKWINSQILPISLKFYPFGLHHTSEKTTFYLPLDENHVSGSVTAQTNVDKNRAVEVDMLTIIDMAALNQHKIIDVLKMDIEGSEYVILDSILNSGIFIGQICIEFHDRFYKNDDLESKDAIKKLKNAGYLIFGVSKSFEEISLIHESLL
jgi:FkbM family methyltransferase